MNRWCEIDEFESILLKFKFCKETAKTLDTWIEHRRPFKDGNQWFIVDLLCDMFVFYLQRTYNGTIWHFDEYADVFSETISKLGYDPHACMVEKLKEIASFKLNNGQAGFFSYEDAKNALIYHNSCYYAIDEYDDHFYAHALPQSGCIFPKWYRANYQNATMRLGTFNIINKNGAKVKDTCNICGAEQIFDLRMLQSEV